MTAHFLAWLRTGIALFGLGFVVAKIALIVQPDTQGMSEEWLYVSAGIVIVLSGAALIMVGYLQHARVRKLLGRNDEHHGRAGR